MKTAILIVTHNHETYIGQLLDSLAIYDRSDIYICDAASTDNTVAEIRRHTTENLLEKSVLEGFAKNNNDLLRFFSLLEKGYEYFLVLNPDVYFDADFITPLMHVLEEREDVAIVAPSVLNPDGTVQHSWKRFPGLVATIKRRLGFPAQNFMTSPGSIDWCLGACMLVRKNFILQRGYLFDERYRMYCEDIDICFDAKVHGYEVLGIDTTSIYHHLQERSHKSIWSRYNYWNVTSIVKFIIKWNYRYFHRLYR